VRHSERGFLDNHLSLDRDRSNWPCKSAHLMKFGSILARFHAQSAVIENGFGEKFRIGGGGSEAQSLDRRTIRARNLFAKIRIHGIPSTRRGIEPASCVTAVRKQQRSRIFLFEAA
jgi:hypothetical protein